MQPPALWIIDLLTDAPIRRVEIPTSMVEKGDGFISMNVDVDAERCGEAFAYMPDMRNSRIYVYE